jgi:hypothetical protein
VFEPLMALDPEAWTPRVQPHLDRIAAYEVERDLLGPDFRRTNVADRTEAERFLLKALEQRDRGNLGAAEQTLLSLETLLADDADSERWRKVTLTLLEQVRERQLSVEGSDGRYGLLTDALERANQLASEGKLSEAREIWRSALDLYDDDPGAASWLEEARRRLAETDSPE